MASFLRGFGAAFAPHSSVTTEITMTRHRGTRNSGWKRNAKGIGLDALAITLGASERAAVGLAKWMTTDHSGMARALANMPPMGFKDTLIFMLIRLVGAVIGAVLTGVWVFLLIAYGIPFLITGHF
jgi:hypothetical protein